MHNNTEKHTWIYMPINRILLAVGCLFVLASCGGGSSSSTTPMPVATVEKINGIVVPPEPDPVKNAATLAGVDSNNNGVRDDVERNIANSTKTQIDFDTALAYSKSYQDQIVASNNISRADALKIVTKSVCLDGKTGDISKLTNNAGLIDNIANTKARRSALAQFNTILGGVNGSEINCD